MDQQAKIVDLVLVNDETPISEIVHCPPLGAIDHDHVGRILSLR